MDQSAGRREIGGRSQLGGNVQKVLERGRDVVGQVLHLAAIGNGRVSTAAPNVTYPASIEAAVQAAVRWCTAGLMPPGNGPSSGAVGLRRHGN
jgi:hypothetical protein